MVTRGVLERNEPGKVRRKIEKKCRRVSARTKTKNEVVNKGDRPYTLENTAFAHKHRSVVVRSQSRRPRERGTE
jgi:hypothetical protein